MSPKKPHTAIRFSTPVPSSSPPCGRRKTADGIENGGKFFNFIVPFFVRPPQVRAPWVVVLVVLTQSLAVIHAVADVWQVPTTGPKPGFRKWREIARGALRSDPWTAQMAIAFCNSDTSSTWRTTLVLALLRFRLRRCGGKRLQTTAEMGLFPDSNFPLVRGTSVKPPGYPVFRTQFARVLFFLLFFFVVYLVIKAMHFCNASYLRKLLRCPIINSTMWLRALSDLICPCVECLSEWATDVDNGSWPTTTTARVAEPWREKHRKRNELGSFEMVLPLRPELASNSIVCGE